MRVMMKKCISAVLVLLLLTTAMLCLPVGASAAAWAKADAVRPAGEGTADSPYLVASGAELAYFSFYSEEVLNQPHVYIELTADVDLGGNAFTPIVSFVAVHLDGQGHKISGLSVGTASSPVADAALFGRMSGGSSFRNLTLENVSVYGSETASALIAKMTVGDMIFSHIRVSGTIVCTGASAGALIGEVDKITGIGASDFTVSYCVNEANITALHYVGGLLGSLWGSINYHVGYCANKGTLTTSCTSCSAGDVIGGIVGYSRSATGIVHQVFSDCYNVGKLVAKCSTRTEVAGIIGDLRGSADAASTGKCTVRVARCFDYSQRDLTTIYKTYNGAIAGYMSNAEYLTKTFEDCFGSNPAGSTDPYSYTDFVGFYQHTNLILNNVGFADSNNHGIELISERYATTIRAQIMRIDAAIAEAVSLDISSKSRNVSARVALTTPSCLMIITDLKQGGESVLPSASGASAYGFAFVHTAETLTPSEIYYDKGTKVAGTPYFNESRFFSYFDCTSLEDIKVPISFVAYAVVGETIVLSEVRTLVIYDMAKDAADDGKMFSTEITSSDEVRSYRLMQTEYDLYATPAPPATTSELKVATYNIAHGGDNGEYLDRMAAMLVEHGIEICGLQELEINGARSAGIDEPAYLAKRMSELTGETYYSAFSVSLDGHVRVYDSSKGNSKYGNAIVSKYPIKNVREMKMWAENQTKQYQTIGANSYEGRSLLIAEIEVNGRTLTVVNTHLDLNHDARMYTLENTVKTQISAIQTPVIFMGDLNAGYSSDELALVQTFLKPTDNMSASISGIDWIFTDASMTCTQLYVPAYDYSDHHPTVATLIW